MSMCEFNKISLVCLRHIVGGGELKVEHSKVDFMKNWTTPKTITRVISFFGEAQYWRKFITNFSSIATHFHALTSVEKVF